MVRSVGVREFRNRATTLLAAGETLVIERHGEPIGFFVPMAAKDRRQGREVLGRLGTALEALGDAAGVDEEELLSEVAGSRPRG